MKPKNPILLLLLALLLFGVISTAALAQDEEEELESTVDELAAEDEAVSDETEDGDYPVCFITEERWDTSPSKVEAIFLDRGQRKRVRFLNLAYLVIGIKLFEENKLGLKVQQVKVVDYATFGTEQERMLELGLVDLKVWFAVSERRMAGTNPPYIAAFDNEEAAKAFATEREGAVYTYDDLMTKIIKAMNTEDSSEFDSNLGFKTQ